MTNMKNDKTVMVKKLKRLIFICVFLPVSNVHAMSFNAGATAGYEVLSYRESAEQLTGGSAAGDSFEQTSFKGLAYGLSGQMGLVRLGALEPIVGLELIHSQLQKSAESDGYTTEGKFNFTHATLAAGARFWIEESLSLNALVGMSQAVSNSMSTLRKSVASQESLGEVSYEIDSHKKNELQLGVSYKLASAGFLLGLGFRIGPGCFECKIKSSAAQSRSYLTRSGSLSVAWFTDGEKNEVAPAPAPVKRVLPNLNNRKAPPNRTPPAYPPRTPPAKQPRRPL